MMEQQFTDGLCQTAQGLGETVHRKMDKAAARIPGGNATLVIGAAAGVYYAYKSGWFGKARDMVCKAVPLLRWGMTKCGVPPPVVQAAPLVRRTCLESAREGSHEVPMPVPKCQVMVGEMKAGEFHAYGNAVRIKDWLVAPAHVLFQVARPCIKGRQSWIEIDTDNYEDLDTDLVSVKLSAKQWSVIGASICSIAHVTYTAGHYVSVVGVSGKGTTGILRDDNVVFGRMVYDGTTLGGYSGAGYMSGPQLVGLHTNGGAVNGGYSASYILVLLNVLDRTKPEDSDDWLRDIIKKKKRVRIDKRWADLDEVRIQVDGRYAVVSRDAMRRAYGADYEDLDPFGDPTGGIGGGYGEALSRTYRDFESVTKPSGEATSSSSGASSIVEKSPDSKDPLRNALMERFGGYSTKRLKQLIQLLKELENTPIPESVPTPTPRRRS